MMLQDKDLEFAEFNKLGDFLMTMRRILSLPNSYKEDFAVSRYLSLDQILESQMEITSTLNQILKEIINETEITWALDDAIDIMLTTGSGLVFGNISFFPFTLNFNKATILVFVSIN